MWCLEKILVVVSVYAMNSTGPRPETCGTPKVRGSGGVEVKPAVKTWVRSVR